MPCLVERCELGVSVEEREEGVEEEVAGAVAGGAVGFWVADGGDEEETAGGHSIRRGTSAETCTACSRESNNMSQLALITAS